MKKYILMFLVMILTQGASAGVNLTQHGELKNKSGECYVVITSSVISAGVKLKGGVWHGVDLFAPKAKKQIINKTALDFTVQAEGTSEEGYLSSEYLKLTLLLKQDGTPIHAEIQFEKEGFFSSGEVFMCGNFTELEKIPGEGRAN